jgi:hypothetical protein
LESFYYFVRTEDVLYRYHAVVAGIMPFANDQLSFYPRILLNLTPAFTFDWSNRYWLDYGLFYYVIIPALIACFFTRERPAHAIALWFLSIFLFMQFGSMSLTMYVPDHRHRACPLGHRALVGPT